VRRVSPRFVCAGGVLKRERCGDVWAKLAVVDEGRERLEPCSIRLDEDVRHAHGAARVLA